MSKMKITDMEIKSIISKESEVFKKRISKEILGRNVARIAAKAISKLDSSFEGAQITDVLKTHFISGFTAKPVEKVLHSLESGATGSNFSSELASIIHKYVSQEAFYRENALKKKYGTISLEDLDRKDVIGDIVEEFKSDDLQLELSESLNEETTSLLQTEENEIIDSAVSEVKTSILDAEEKAEVTRAVISEFKKISEQIQEERNSLNPDKDGDKAGESITFDSTEFIKSKIPVTAQRFVMESEKGSFTKDKITDVLLTIEEFSDNYDDDRDFFKKRIDAIRNDAVDIKDFDISKVSNLEELFKEAVKDVDATFSAFRLIGIDYRKEMAFKPDADTLNAIKMLSDLKAKDKAKRINDLEIIANAKVEEIKDDASFIKMSFENFELKSAIADEISVYDTHRAAIELRDEYLAEFLIDGMKHIPAAHAKRIEEIHFGLKKLSNIGVDVKPEKLKKIYYKTAQVVDPSILADFKSEAERVKTMISDTYSTKKYDGVVDDFFDSTRRANTSMVTEENFYELSAYKAALEFSTESNSFSSEDTKDKIKKYAAISATYLKTLEKLKFIDKSDMKAYAKDICK